MTFTTSIKYYEAPDLFDGKAVVFYPPESRHAAVTPESPVYARAKTDFNQSGYMYPAPPLYLGQKEVQFPDNEIYVLRLLVKEPNSPFVLPEKLGFMKNILKDSAAYQKSNFPDFDNRFVYLTVRSGNVKSQRDDEMHVDGFQGISVPRHIPEQNYIWADSNPTHVSLQPYFVEAVDPAKHNIHTYFEKATHPANVMQGVEKGLYVIDPYHVHARPRVESGIRRAFFRICYSPVEIRDDTCMRNPFFNRGPYGRKDIRDVLTDFDGLPSNATYGLRPLAG